MIWIKLCSIVFLSLSLMFTGCKSQSNEEVYVSDLYNIHEEYQDAWGNVGKYDISLPRIHCDSKSAKKLNKTIKNEYKDLIHTLNEAKEEKYTLPDTSISYKEYWNKKMVSLVIKEEVEADDPRYKVYYFDFKTKKRVSNKKLYKKYKINQKDTKAWAAQAFDQEYADEYFDNVKELRAQTICSLPSNLDMYVQKGKLNILIPIATNFGSGIKVVAYQPKRKKSYKIEDSSTFDQTTLTLKDNKLSLYFAGTQKTYEVHGCFNEYKQVHVYEIGPGVTYGFALTTNGLVEVIAIEDGLPIERVCSQGPLYGLDKVKSLRSGQALTEKDQLIDLFDALRNQPFKSLEGTYTNESVTLQIDENGLYAMQDQENSHSGLLFSVGMEEDGFVYGYDDYNQQVLSYCKVMPLYEKLEIKNLFDHDKLELEYKYE